MGGAFGHDDQKRSPCQAETRGGEKLKEKGAEVGLIQIERTGIFMRKHLPNFGHSAEKSGYLQFAVYRL